MNDTLSILAGILAERRGADPDESYVASLHHQGLNKILEKVGEEAAELIIAAKDAQHSGNRSDLVAETADLWFHSMVVLSHLDGDINEVLQVLRQRFGLSGLAEKASRNTGNEQD